jgi:hypothetical protein
MNALARQMFWWEANHLLDSLCVMVVTVRLIWMAQWKVGLQLAPTCELVALSREGTL